VRGSAVRGSAVRGAAVRDSAGVDLLPAPAAVPEEEAIEEEVDRELVDLLCDDPVWLDETFRDIVATSWDEPPRGGWSRNSARPRRYGVSSRRVPRRGRHGRSQWWPSPHHRQRSPPRS